MKDKPIMIDDVDVAGCRHFNNNDKGYNQETEEFVKGACECIAAHDSYGEFMYYGICKGRDCYYKQLKRKEQECEHWKHQAELGADTTDRLIKELEEKEQECEQLKKSVRSNKDKRKRSIERYLKLKEFTNKEFEKLEVELKEFKNMAKQGLDNYKDVGGCWGCGISFSFNELLKSYKKLENSYLEATKESPTATRINAKFNKYEQALQEIKEIANMCLCEDDMSKMILEKCEVLDV